jgi:hypothetical protein
VVPSDAIQSSPSSDAGSRVQGQAGAAINVVMKAAPTSSTVSYYFRHDDWMDAGFSGEGRRRQAA